MGTGRARQRDLDGAADRGDYTRSGPAGELNGRVADSAGAARHQHGGTPQGAGRDTPRSAVMNGQRAVGGQGRDAQGGAEFERSMVGQGDGMPVGDECVLLCRPPGPLPRGLPDPHPLSDPLRVDLRTDGIDHPGAVLVGHLLVHALRQRPSAATPVGGVDARDVHTNPYLAGAGHGHRTLDELEDLGAAGSRPNDGLHLSPFLRSPLGNSRLAPGGRRFVWGPL